MAKRTEQFDMADGRLEDAVRRFRLACTQFGYTPVENTDYDVRTGDGVVLQVRVSGNSVDVYAMDGGEGDCSSYFAGLRHFIVGNPVPDPSTRVAVAPVSHGDDAKSVEQLQREVLLLQKRKLERDLKHTPVTFGSLIGAILISWLVVSLIGGICLSIALHNMRKEQEEEQLRQSLYSQYDSDYGDYSDYGSDYYG